jgi:hypothetical protein
MTRQTCFVVMPFGTKATGNAGSSATSAKPAPARINFDRLWKDAFEPTLDALGYDPVRADAEAGSVILADMLQRLRYADLVLADLSIPNGNVYYEVGIRHAAQRTGCVLISADWSEQLFDVDQMRSLRYPHAAEIISREEVDALRTALLSKVPDFSQSETPYFKLTPAVDQEVFRKKLQAIHSLQAKLAELRLRPAAEAAQLAKELVASLLAPGQLPAVDVITELALTLRDLELWQLQGEFLAGLPASLRAIDLVEEQVQLARSKLADHEGAAAALEILIKAYGGTPERHGLLGGRYKKLWSALRSVRAANGSTPTVEERRYLMRAIESYEAGMRLDLNQYYCSCNLPALYRARGATGDEVRARTVDAVVLQACQRASILGIGDNFLDATMFGAAFRAGDVVAAREALGRMLTSPSFVRKTTRDDALLWLSQTNEGDRPALQALVDELLSDP